MRVIIAILFSTILILQIAAQGNWQRAKVSGDTNFLNTIGSLGIPVEGEILKGEYLVCDFSAEQITKMEQAGLIVEILIPDVQTH